MDTAQQLVQSPHEPALAMLFMLVDSENHPLLPLPEFPAAIEALARTVDHPEEAQSYYQVAKLLHEFLTAQREMDPVTDAGLLLGCANSLVGEASGDVTVNTGRAIELARYVRSIVKDDSKQIAATLMLEGKACLRRAVKEASARGDLTEAIRLFGEARTVLGRGDENYPRCLAGEAVAHVQLAEITDERQEHLEQAARCYREARDLVHAGSPDFAAYVAGEETVRRPLAALTQGKLPDKEAVLGSVCKGYG